MKSCFIKFFYGLCCVYIIHSYIYADRRYTESLDAFKEEYIRKINTDRMNQDGLKQVKSGNITAAVKLFKGAVVHEDKKIALTYNNLGYAHFLNGNYRDSKKYYKESFKRNKKLLYPHQNIGYIYYKEKQWYLAVKHGEQALSLDPDNEPVLSWIDKARSKLKKSRKHLLKKANRKLFCKKAAFAEKTIKQTKHGLKLKDDQDIEAEDKYLCDYPFGIELVLYSEINFRHSGGFAFIQQPGNPGLPPLGFTLDYNPPGYPLHIKIYFKKPYLGVVNPQIIDYEFNSEFIFHIKSFFIGLGILAAFANLNNYDNLFQPHVNLGNIPADIFTQFDYKFGLLIGADAPQDYFLIRVYTHFALRDSLRAREGFATRFDQSHFDLIYKHIFLPNKKFPFTLQFGISSREIFITEYGRNLINTVPIFVGSSNLLSHYVGHYDFSIDFAFGKLNKGPKVDFTMGFGLTVRTYMRGDNNPNVQTLIGNGQGFFGLQFTGGNLLAGLNTYSYIPKLYLEEVIFRHILLRQHFAYEIASRSIDPSALLMRFDIGFIF